MKIEEFSLEKVFKDARKHQEIAKIIKSHLVNRSDIREMAFGDLDLTDSKDILDLGCGFGFFTQALKGRVHPEAMVTGIDRHPEYEWFFFQSCDKAGIKADFKSKGIEHINNFRDNAYDLILCSYALYFFPESIAEISRILKPDGVFIAITHAIPHMTEFMTYIRGILKQNGLILTIDMPYEELISRFSNLNGKKELEPYFSQISTLDYKASLAFGKNDHKELVEYFNFKHAFFIPEVIDPDDSLHNKVSSSIKKDLLSRNGLKISKNDIIFVCKQPKAYA